MIMHPPKIRYETADGDSNPIEATIQYDGRLRIESDPDACRLSGAWLTTDEAREFALELLGLADAADIISGKAP